MHTVVSLVPFEINERKAGQVPPSYFIPSAEKELQVIHVDDASCGIYLGDDRTLPQVIVAAEVARGLVEDFVTAQLEYRPGVAKPALFTLPGKVSAEEVKKFHQNEIAIAKSMQTQWFRFLVQKADDDWKKYGRHTAITDSERCAAKALGLKKDWLLTADDMTDCPACSNKVRADIALCPHCHCILDEEKASKLKFAKVG